MRRALIALGAGLVTGPDLAGPAPVVAGGGGGEGRVGGAGRYLRSWRGAAAVMLVGPEG